MPDTNTSLEENLASFDNNQINDSSGYYSMLYTPQPWSNISYIVEGELCEKWR
jgi:hypothetical protein